VTLALEPISTSATVVLALLPDHFWDGFGGAVLGAILGGILAAGGGYLATRHIRQLDIQRDLDQAIRDYRAAVVVVSEELFANRVVALHYSSGGPHFITDTSSIGLSDASYLAVEHFLADRLPQDARDAMVRAYIEIRSRDSLFGPLSYQTIGGGGSTYTRLADTHAMTVLAEAMSLGIRALETERHSWSLPAAGDSHEHWARAGIAMVWTAIRKLPERR
jgi:hypothetical protein